MNTDLGVNLCINMNTVFKTASELFKFDIEYSFKNLTKKVIKNVKILVGDKMEYSDSDIINLIQTLVVIGDYIEAPHFYNDYLFSRIFQDDNLVEKIMKELINVGYSIEKRQNKRLYYAIFHILTHKEDIYFLYN